jgi:hypothetical protein
MNITSVLDHWIEIFAARLQEGTSDDLRMNVIKKFPFQDDPIRKAPYLLIGEHPDDGIVPDLPTEIGGTAWWRLNLRIKAAPKPTKSADRAYYLVDLLGQRIVHTLRSNALLGQTISVPGLQLSNRDWNFITKVTHKVYGGESEWLSYVEIEFFQRAQELGPFPYGAYPEDFIYA